MSKANLFLAGAARAGTTWLHGILAAHPQVAMSWIKEPNYFGDNDRLLSERRYEALFDDKPGARWRGEASVSYLAHGEAGERIARYNPDARVILVLRRPVHRLLSAYRYARQHGFLLDASFGQFLEQAERGQPSRIWHEPASLLHQGRYREHLPRLARALGRERVRVMLYDDLQADRAAFVARLFAHLDLSPPVGIETERCPNASGGRPRSKRVGRWLHGPSAARACAAALLPAGVRGRVKRVLDRANRSADAPRVEPEALERALALHQPDVACVERWLGVELPAWRCVESVQETTMTERSVSV